MGILIKGMDEIPEDGAVLVVKHDNGKAYIKHACTYGYSMELVKLPAVQPEQVCVATVTLTDEQVKEAVEKAKNAVISVIEPEPHWIPCSERLPEKNCRCLTTNEAWGSFEVDWNAWIDGQWLYPNEKPIAWMSLPEPYRGGEK